VTLPTATSFDAVVIGAGPAGATAALLLARAGWSVALVEQQAFPRRTVCGECIAASNLPLLQLLGVADSVMALAGPELRRVTLMRADRAVTADLPPAGDGRFAWGRALGRDTLDGLLLEQARAAGASLFQPWAVQAIVGEAGAWHCELRGAESSTLLRLRTGLVIDAHGSWEDLPTDRARRRLARSATDLFAFQAHFTATSLPAGAISVLALDGGYGGMVVADGGTMTVACCIQRARLSALRVAAPGMRAGDVVDAWLQRGCQGARHALQGAVREGPWLTAGPLRPGAHRGANDGIFRIGNAAGEAHPILGEGMSMALQSAALLASVLLGRSGAAAVPDANTQRGLQRAYATAWRTAFATRLRLAAFFAHLAMGPYSAGMLLHLVGVWPGLLTRGARWGGKIHCAAPMVPQAHHPGPATRRAANPVMPAPACMPQEEKP
jgi:2-polyprenyl-6-methoxyphenol hydroxylase-like FAD-dependent oxidoreductase